MGAHSEVFPWPSYLGHYRFFEERMSEHSKVTSLTALRDGLYKLERTQGDMLHIFICECYAFGIAQYIEVKERLDELDAVIINSSWCEYSPEAKRHCRGLRVGLFMINQFMKALHHSNYWTYLTKEEKKHFKEQGWL